MTMLLFDVLRDLHARCWAADIQLHSTMCGWRCPRRSDARAVVRVRRVAVRVHEARVVAAVRLEADVVADGELSLTWYGTRRVRARAWTWFQPCEPLDAVVAGAVDDVAVGRRPVAADDVVLRPEVVVDAVVGQPPQAWVPSGETPIRLLRKTFASAPGL